MNLTVFGASGKVGRLVVDEALHRGHKVRAVTRVSNIFTNGENLEVFRANIYNKVAVSQAVEGSDVIISCLGSWGTPKKDVLSSAMKSIIPAMKMFKVSRIISLTGSDSLAANDQSSFIHRNSHKLLGKLAPKILNDADDHIKLLENSQLDYVIVRSPAMLSFGNPQNYELTSLRPMPWQLINRKSVACAMIDLAEVKLTGIRAPYITRK